MKNQHIGVVVGRFQTAYLHEGHRYLFEEVLKLSNTLCVLLGDHDGVPHDYNPLDFATRRKMILEAYPEAVILKLDDCDNDLMWSKRVDDILRLHFKEAEITLYGSRDSFIPVYKGSYPTVAIEEKIVCSATHVRKRECCTLRSTEDFRAGVIYAAETRFPIVYGTVDIAVVREDEKGTSVLLGTKKGDGGLKRFVGGFIDKKDDSHEAAARRELREEVGDIEIGAITYVSSHKVSDYRYRLSKDSVITTLFMTQYIFGHAEPKDDLDEVDWIPLSEIKQQLIWEHRGLADSLISHLNKQKINN